MGLPGLPEHAQQYGDMFEEVADAVGVGPYLLAAICSRESDFGELLIPKGPAGTGDNGHGRGLMQIDDRTWKEFCSGELWKDPFENIKMGATIYKSYLVLFNYDEFPAICAYNCGPTRVHRVLSKMPPNTSVEQSEHILDSYTAERNYASDVIRRREQFLNQADLAMKQSKPVVA